LGHRLKASRACVLARSRFLARWLRPDHLAMLLLMCLPATFAQAQAVQVQAPSPALASIPSAPASAPQPSAAELDPEPHPVPGSVSGIVTSPDGSVYEGAHITLQSKASATNPATALTAITDSDGRFHFPVVPAGPFELTVSAAGFASQTISSLLHPGESLETKPLVLLFASATSQVEVTASQTEIATEQLHIEEEQRVFGVIPNFYVVYTPNAVPLSPRQKFHLAWRSEIDPFTIAASAASAGIEQAQNTFSGYGQGAQGYFKRFGANYADSFIGNMLGGAAFPAVFKQDPRYFYNGKGTIRHRALYAIANAVICKGDNGHWQFNYSGLLGSMAAGGISYTYYPASNRDGADLFVENTFIGIGGSAIGNLFQEFVVRKLTPHLPNYTTKP
jgi:hypothetical protein